MSLNKTNITNILNTLCMGVSQNVDPLLDECEKHPGQACVRLIDRTLRTMKEAQATKEFNNVIEAVSFAFLSGICLGLKPNDPYLTSVSSSLSELNSKVSALCKLVDSGKMTKEEADKALSDYVVSASDGDFTLRAEIMEHGKVVH